MIWSVRARATFYLMERFFHHLNAGLGRADALSGTQSDIRRVRAGELRQFQLGWEILQELPRTYGDDECPLSNPYFWGAWVLKGEIGPLGGKKPGF